MARFVVAKIQNTHKITKSLYHKNIIVTPCHTNHYHVVCFILSLCISSLTLLLIASYSTSPRMPNAQPTRADQIPIYRSHTDISPLPSIDTILLLVTIAIIFYAISSPILSIYDKTNILYIPFGITVVMAAATLISFLTRSLSFIANKIVWCTLYYIETIILNSNCNK